MKKYSIISDKANLELANLLQKEFSSFPDGFFYFWKAHSLFSQWYPCTFSNSKQEFNCTEQYMMFNKAMLFKDKKIAAEILLVDNPKEQKELGKKVKNFDSLIWDSKKISIVLNGNYLKFSQNEHLLKELLKTKDRVLVEASPYDKVWGIGMTEEEAKEMFNHSWKGQNLLGYILTALRVHFEGLSN